MSQINISNLTFGYDGSSENVFESASFSLDTSWRLGLIGRNGRGKTTLFRLLTGELTGSGSISASVDFEYFPYHVADPDAFAIDIVRETAPDAEDWEIYREMSLLGVDADIAYNSFRTLSGGEQAKIMLIGMFLRRNSFMLIDEPTNHLDAEGRRSLGEYLRRKSGFIIISHDRKFLDSCTDHIMSINRQTIEVTKGNWSEWQRNKDMRDSFELAQNKKLKKEIRHLESAAKRAAEWSDRAEQRKIGFDPTKVEKSLDRRAHEGAKAKKLMARSKAITERRENAVREKEQLLGDLERTTEIKIQPLEFHAHRLIALENISLGYGDRIVCSGVSFSVESGERIALTGGNGCGKSSVLKLICGEDISHSGSIFKNGQLKISYVPQSTEHLHGSLREYAEQLGIELSLFLAILRKLDFSRSQFDRDISGFSEGQKKKVLIAGSLCERAHLYIWDEPLNYIDIISRVQIEDMLLSSRPAMIFVEHDEAFCEKIADRIVRIGRS